MTISEDQRLVREANERRIREREQLWVLPLRVHPETDYIVLDADGNQVADCWPPGLEFDHNRERSIKRRNEAARIAEAIVLSVNNYAFLEGELE